MYSKGLDIYLIFELLRGDPDTPNSQTKY